MNEKNEKNLPALFYAATGEPVDRRVRIPAGTELRDSFYSYFVVIDPRVESNSRVDPPVRNQCGPMFI